MNTVTDDQAMPLPPEEVEAFTVACAKASTVPGATAADCYRAGIEAVALVLRAQAAATERERIATMLYQEATAELIDGSKRAADALKRVADLLDGTP